MENRWIFKWRTAYIKRFPTFFSVSMYYDAKAVEYFRSLSSKFWHKEKKEWTFPNGEYEDLVAKMAALNIITEITDELPQPVFDQAPDEDVHLTIEYDPMLNGILKKLGAKWDASTKKWTMRQSVVPDFITEYATLYKLSEDEVHEKIMDHPSFDAKCLVHI